ncbi:hypothetical protein [Effusibacillus dendaii]|nr:hypothetical protein [Effusibacillus dendaii]
MEWLFVLILVAIGLSCLTMSANVISGLNSFHAYLHTMLQICVWAVIPVIVAVVIYLIIRKKGDS